MARTNLADVGKFVLKGYQADIDGRNMFTGMLYEERGRRILAHTSEKVIIDAQGQPWVPDVPHSGVKAQSPETTTCSPVPRFRWFHGFVTIPPKPPVGDVIWKVFSISGKARKTPSISTPTHTMRGSSASTSTRVTNAWPMEHSVAAGTSRRVQDLPPSRER